jgi:HSP20 family protein
MASNVAVKPNGHTETTAPSEGLRGLIFTPRVDIVETNDELLLCADMPGVKPADVDIHFENGELMVHGRCTPRQSQDNYLLTEYGVGDFYRAFNINETVDTSKITAEFKNGVLTVHLPKSEAAKPRKIAVTGM